MPRPPLVQYKPTVECNFHCRRLALLMVTFITDPFRLIRPTSSAVRAGHSCTEGLDGRTSGPSPFSSIMVLPALAFG